MAGVQFASVVTGWEWKSWKDSVKADRSVRMKRSRILCCPQFCSNWGSSSQQYCFKEKSFFYLLASSSLFRMKLSLLCITEQSAIQSGAVAVQESQAGFPFTFQTAEQLCCGLLTQVYDAAWKQFGMTVCSSHRQSSEWNAIICAFGYLCLFLDSVSKLLGFCHFHTVSQMCFEERSVLFFSLLFPSKALLSCNTDCCLAVMTTAGAVRTRVLSHTMLDLLFLWGSQQNQQQFSRYHREAAGSPGSGTDRCFETSIADCPSSQVGMPGEGRREQNTVCKARAGQRCF